MAQFHELTISNLNKVTDKSVSITFSVPEHLQNDFSFKAGQYLTLKTSINGKDVRRDYSICSSPKSNQLTVAVKEVENGTFSTYANQKLTVNDVLEVAEPNGRFVFIPDNTKSRTIAAFAAGSGITPVISIVKCLLEEEPNSSAILVYGNKSMKDAMFLEEILELQKQHPERLALKLIFSQAQEPNALFGRIEKSTINLILRNEYKDTNIDAFYLCGPEPMVHAVKDVLIEHEISESDIFFELFKVSKPEAITPDIGEGNTHISIIVDDEEHSFEMSQKQTILEAALDEDLDAPYSCQGGICSSCLARVTEGSAVMRQNNILTDKEVAEGLILTCQAQPTSASISVDYDDV